MFSSPKSSCQSQVFYLGTKVFNVLDFWICPSENSKLGFSSFHFRVNFFRSFLSAKDPRKLRFSERFLLSIGGLTYRRINRSRLHISHKNVKKCSIIFFGLAAVTEYRFFGEAFLAGETWKPSCFQLLWCVFVTPAAASWKISLKTTQFVLLQNRETADFYLLAAGRGENL